MLRLNYCKIGHTILYGNKTIRIYPFDKGKYISEIQNKKKKKLEGMKKDKKKKSIFVYLSLEAKKKNIKIKKIKKEN